MPAAGASTLPRWVEGERCDTPAGAYGSLSGRFGSRGPAGWASCRADTPLSGRAVSLYTIRQPIPVFPAELFSNGGCPPSPPAPLPILGEGSKAKVGRFPLSQNWERGPGGEGGP